MTWLPGTRIIQAVIMPAAKNFLPYFHLHLFAFSFQSLILVIPFSDRLKSSLVLTIFSPGRCFYPVIKLLLNLFFLIFFFLSRLSFLWISLYFFFTFLDDFSVSFLFLL